MTKIELKRKILILTAISIIIASCILDFLGYYIIESNKSLCYEVVRIAIVCLICYYIYLGKKWARELSIFLLVIAAIICSVGIFSLFGNVKFGIFAFIYVLLYSIAAYLLIVPKEVKEFFNSKSAK